MNQRLIFCIALVFILLFAACAIRVIDGKDPAPSPAVSEAPSEAPAVPTVSPAEASAETAEPTAEPEDTPKPTEEPIVTAVPSAEPTQEPTVTAVPTVAPTQTPVSGSVSASDPDSPALLRSTGDMGQDYVDQIIFLGDSTTYGMKYYGVLSGGKNTLQVWTPTSGTLTLSYQGFAAILYPDTDTEITIREAVELKKPAMMVITLGVNGISFMDHDSFVAEYTDLVTDIMEISPDTKVVIQSIFPVASTYEYLSSINNEKITAANGWLVEIAESTGARYLNTISALIGEDGWLPQNLQNGDGLHLNTDGFNIVLNYIRTHGWE